MSTTPTFRVQLFSAPPPTNNTLDPEERSRLLRSTRKLGAVLGSTPYVLEPEAENSMPLAPRVHASRREGRVFHSRSSSISSMETSEPEYVLVKSSSRSAPYQYQSVSPSSSRSPSPARVSKKRKGGSSGTEGVPPIAIIFDISGSTKAQSRTALSRSKEQPLLLRLRSIPKQKAIDSYADSVTTVDPSNPLSPAASSFKMDTTTSSNALSDREKRKKMAKLTRTLGENVPPELVFRSSAHRRTSTSASRPYVDPLTSLRKPSKFISSVAAPPLAVAAAPQSSTRTESQELQRKQNPRAFKRTHRPRSLTLGNASAISAANISISRGTTSLDVRPKGLPKSKEEPFAALQKAPVPESQSTEWGRRKEREWSGEWNIKDMEDVAKKLRGLKGR